MGPLPGLNFRLFGFPVSIGIDFLFVAVFLGLGARAAEPVFLVEWLVVLTAGILLHELGHAFMLRRYSIHPSIRLWGLGGLTTYGFTLPPRKAILVSAAGPAIGIPVGLAVQFVGPWLPDVALLQVAASDAVFVLIGWGILNLLPIAGLDGGNIVQDVFLLAFGSRGRTPGLVVVAVASIVIAVASLALGSLYVAILIAFFALVSPAPYQELWRTIGGGGGGYAPAPKVWRGQRLDTPVEPRRGRRFGGFGLGGLRGLRGRERGPADVSSAERSYPQGRQFEPVPEPPRVERRRTPRHPSSLTDEVRRRFGETYADVFGDPIDLDELSARPEPLLSDVSEMLRRKDAAALAGRLIQETDPLAILVIIGRTVDAGRGKALLDAVRAHRDGHSSVDSLREREQGLLKLQVGFYALGRHEESMAAGQELPRTADPARAQSVLLLARSAARRGDRRRAREDLARAIELGVGELSESALGDLARLGPDQGVADLLARLRRERLH